jgi:hypothetical protein
MTSPLLLSYGRQLDELVGFIAKEWRPDSPEAMFALHVFDSAGEAGPVPGRPALSALDGVEVGRAPALAVAGYQLAHLSSAPPDLAEKWRAGVKRLSEKNPFPPDRQAFPFRPLELYGIVLGAGRLLAADSPERAWLAGVLRRLETTAVTGLWAKVIGRLAASHLGVKWSGDWPAPAACQTAEELAALRWVASAAEHAGTKHFDVRAVDEAILKTAAVTQVEPTDVARAAVLYHALRRAAHERLESDLAATWQVSRPTQDALELVTVLCRRFHHFARQIQVRRESRNTIQFTDEYDVQDAMHALLRLHFPDVRAEEWTPSYGGRSTRTDFLLKPERVMIEVKMTRRSLNQREVISQLTEDKERYRSHPDCQALVCFVYDPAGVCDNPAALENDVSVRTGDFRVEVVVAPQGS